MADLSLEFELERPPSIIDLLSVIVNREDVENLINRPVSTHYGCSALTLKTAWMKMHMYRYLVVSTLNKILSRIHYPHFSMNEPLNVLYLDSVQVLLELE